MATASRRWSRVVLVPRMRVREPVRVSVGLLRDRAEGPLANCEFEGACDGGDHAVCDGKQLPKDRLWVRPIEAAGVHTTTDDREPDR